MNPPPAIPELRPDEVHVWRASLECDASALTQYRQLLSTDERARADRFYFPKHREHFTAGRGQLRTILGAYLGSDPAGLRFAYGLNGKPALENHPLRFNLAHSHGLALLAIAQDQEVGVDVERVRSEVATADIAGRFFSPHEVAALTALPETERVAAFFRCWSRKEAYIKAVGKGLGLPLDSFDVTLAPGEPAALLAIRDDDGAIERWSMTEVPVPERYAAALVAEGHNWRVRCGDWPG